MINTLDLCTLDIRTLSDGVIMVGISCIIDARRWRLYDGDGDGAAGDGAAGDHG